MSHPPPLDCLDVAMQVEAPVTGSGTRLSTALARPRATPTRLPGAVGHSHRSNPSITEGPGREDQVQNWGLRDRSVRGEVRLEDGGIVGSCEAAAEAVPSVAP